MANKSLLVFDGVCNLCVGAVKVLRTLDRYRIFSFLPYQRISDETKSKYNLTAENWQGEMHIVLADGRVVSGAAAISEICEFLTPISFLCGIFRTAGFQKLYAWLASRRYGVFGCRQSCYLISENPPQDL